MEEQRLAAEARRPIDLGQAPLWRVLWLRLAADEQVLLLNFHHSLMDVWSLRLLFREAAGLHDSIAVPGSARPAPHT